jgi:hypothetical protein
MSFQPQVPMMTQQPMAVVAQRKGKRRKGLMLFGLIFLVAGLAGAVVVASKATANYESAVKSLARAPVGCTTTLVFDKAATFNVFIETKGKLADLSGDCDANGVGYDHAGDKLPKPSMTLLDNSDNQVDLQRGATATYDVGGYVGTAVRTVTIAKAGTYKLDVESDDTDFAVAIGKDPQTDSETMKRVGGAIGLGGIVLGLPLLLLGLRRRPPATIAGDIRNPAAPMPGWPPGPYAGTMPPAPPTMPPNYGSVVPPPQQPLHIPGQPPQHVAAAPPTSVFAPPSPVQPTGGSSVPAPPAPPIHPVESVPTLPAAPTPGQPYLPDDRIGWTRPEDDPDADRPPL